ncbi:MAG TPA: LamG domain-containing protein [Polyangia bacterium]|nr:LamG domain-containing protein [Polyangia bacterium]
MSRRQTPAVESTSLCVLALCALALSACGRHTSNTPDGGHPDAATGGTGGSGGQDAAAGSTGAGGSTSDAADDGDAAPIDAAPDVADANGGDVIADAGTDATDASDASDATDATDASSGDGSTACDGEATCVAVAGSLSGLLWKLPCTTDSTGPACPTTASTTQMATLAGTAGTTYDVTLHFRGIVEQKTYAGGCAPGGGMWLSGGADDGDTFNVYRLSISSPPQTYFLNAGASSINHLFPIDFQQTVRIDAGATVTLFADAKDGLEIINVGSDMTTPITVTGASVQQPYDGQFIQMDVVGLQTDAVSSTAAVGGGSGGSAVSFDGSQGQRVTIADAASLRPANVTLESWFTMAAPVGAYAVVASKGVGAAYADSWVIWFESGALHTGVDLNSTAASAATPWAPAANQWHHAAEVFDATAMQNLLYVDGQLVGCSAGAPPITYDANPMLIGADTDSGGFGGFWSGAIDEVRVFSTARTSAQIWSDMHTHKLGPTTGLVGEWTFDEGTGQTTADQSGSGNTGTLGATNTAETTDPTWVNSGAPF